VSDLGGSARSIKKRITLFSSFTWKWFEYWSFWSYGYSSNKSILITDPKEKLWGKKEIGIIFDNLGTLPSVHTFDLFFA